jgi:hypothetical protein
MNILSAVDFFMVPLWLIIIFAVASTVVKTRYANDPSRAFFFYGLSLKLFGGIMLGVVYQYYYSSGDTISYYLAGKGLANAFIENFGDGVALFTVDSRNIPYEILMLSYKYSDLSGGIPYIQDVRSFNVCRVVSIANLLSINSYYASSLILSSFSFIGLWGFFRVFAYQFPEARRPLAFVFFYIPSVFFWGSGILKDSITLGFLGLMIYCLHRYMLSRFRGLLFLLFALVSGYLIYSIKPYILLSIIPFLAIWFNNNIKENIKNGLLRFSVTPTLLLFSMLVSVLAVQTIGDLTERFSFDNLLNHAVDVKSDLIRGYYYSDEKGSSYNIGEFDASFTSQVLLFPNALLTTYFRPYVWEVRNPLMGFAAAESLILLGLTIFVLLRTGLINFIRIIAYEPFLIFTLGYSASFAYMVGLTSGNFGNLVRYKIPCIPFFVASLVVIYHIYQERKSTKGRIDSSFQKNVGLVEAK